MNERQRPDAFLREKKEGLAVLPGRSRGAYLNSARTVAIASVFATTLSVTRSAPAQVALPEAHGAPTPPRATGTPAGDETATSSTAPAPALPLAREPESSKLNVTPLGYVETYYAYNFNRPSNGITHYRGFDNRHNTFTLSNAALGATAEYDPVTVRLILQYGSTPSTYYLAEPTAAGGPGANASGAELWKYLQEANIAWRAPVGRGLVLQVGLVPSPIGAEVFAVKDNWNYSRSNLFFGLPFYHAGLRATYPWTEELSTTIAVFNGWNSVVDNNEEKSLQTNVTYTLARKLLVQALYFGGVERPAASRPEGPYWRHDLDLILKFDMTPWLSAMAQANHGWEPNRIGTARWTGAALYARVKPIDHVFFAIRGDRFHEHLATNGHGGSSAPLFWGGVEWVSSATTTLDVRPHDHVSVRFEYRHDVAASPLYFRGDVRVDQTNARTQSTLLVGATAWF